jgi:hypothetical protein
LVEVEVLERPVGLGRAEVDDPRAGLLTAPRAHAQAPGVEIPRLTEAQSRADALLDEAVEALQALEVDEIAKDLYDG